MLGIMIFHPVIQPISLKVDRIEIKHQEFQGIKKNMRKVFFPPTPRVTPYSSS